MLLNDSQLMFTVLLAMGIASTNLKSQQTGIDDKDQTQAKRPEAVKKLADVEYDFQFEESIRAVVREQKPEEAKGITPFGIRITSAEQANKIAALKTIRKQVDFDKQDLVLFRCHNVSSHVTGKEIKQDGKPSTILFTYHQGTTKDLKSHFVIFAIDQELKVKMADAAILKKQ